MDKDKKQKQKSEPTTNNTSKGPSERKMPRIAIALGSGMAWGFAHIGILKALNRHGIYPQIVAGSSIGAVVGGCYLSDKLPQLEDWVLSLNRRKVFSYLDFRSRSASLISGKKFYNELALYFTDMKIEDLGLPFIAIASDLATGHEIWLRKGDLITAMSASFALPGVFPPVELNHRLLVDGALVNPVPVAPCQALGSRLTMAVDVNADPIGKSSLANKRFQTIAGFDVFNDAEVSKKDQKVFGSSIARRIFRRLPGNPSLFGVMVSALNIMQDRLTRSRLAGDPPDVHIKPRIGHIGMLEFEKAEELIAAGEQAVEDALPDIKACMNVLLPSH